MTTLITGGTGFIGQHVVRLLCQQGECVHLLVRSAKNLCVPSGDNVKLCFGDLTDLQSVQRAIQGCGRVIHLAALAKVWVRNPSVFERVNVYGTRNVLAAAMRVDVEKLVFVSSCSAIVLSPAAPPDERAITQPQHFNTEYARSKYMAEKEVELASSHGPNIVIVYPSRVYGPGLLSEGNAATKVFKMHLRGRFPFMLGDGRTVANWAYVEDVAQGIVDALEFGRPGERYFLGGENASLKHVFELIDMVARRKHRHIHVSKSLALKLARFEEWKAAWLGIAPLITQGWVEALSQSSPLACMKAVREIGYRVTPMQAGLEKTVRWLQEMEMAHGG